MHVLRTKNSCRCKIFAQTQKKYRAFLTTLLIFKEWKSGRWGQVHGGVYLRKKELTWKLESARKPVEVYPGNFIYYKLLGLKFLHEFCKHNFLYYLFHTDRDLDTKCQNTYLDQVILEFFPVCLYFRHANGGFHAHFIHLRNHI